MTRLVLAATLAANYGIYGPAYELLEGTPREPRSEEYRDSEKYQLRHWNLAAEGNLSSFVATVNRIRRDNHALQGDWSLRFCAVDNDQLIAYAKTSGDNTVVCVVNLDPDHTQSGWVELDSRPSASPRAPARDARPADRATLLLAGRAQLRDPRPEQGAGARHAPRPARSHRA
jgi:starch synthase (maltosyl-transferring)